MRIEASLRTTPTHEVAVTAAELERAGAGGVCDSENRRDPLLTMAMAAVTTERIGLATAVTIAFPRSPMVVAYGARMLHDQTGGRFRLGLGTQVKRHMEHRFGVPWDSPGPRMRDYVQALRAVWRSWETGEPLRHSGPFYALDLMTPEFSPGPAPHGRVAVDLAAVNPYNLELAAELCDGVRLHVFNTPGYVRDVVRPRLAAGAGRAGRDLAGFEIFGGGFVATGATRADVALAREQARARVAFYGSTLAYLPVLEHHGWGALRDELRELVRRERWDDLAAAVPDEVLDEFCTAAAYPELAAALGARWAGLVTTVQVPAPVPYSAQWSGFAEACVAVGEL
ncbi:TIGR03617 family F420-dependent LLM class oxidoreductase [Geodermatophilus sp. DF01-2]|uniref:TIGR03617 family F420-dependent LLM class oxidoreductase n=1 Tax=Geodermatophilus sp. DF01-2 TaxID=2559610 RepID=UPI001073D3FE|nr:TIGR03617 family F420-dependent LLM class oxidoreductase [Geodermatophilus sp. DF01_2]TFV64725.1 TIGR03617 family F420-dependent LLM class oxidoreductase [Geodermatophilus sp. DF01_2]